MATKSAMPGLRLSVQCRLFTAFTASANSASRGVSAPPPLDDAFHRLCKAIAP
jgi:hypothetical protein